MEENLMRTAILQAADHIDANPKEFYFWTAEVPTRRSCGTPGCALGWIAHFAAELLDMVLLRLRYDVVSELPEMGLSPEMSAVPYDGYTAKKLCVLSYPSTVNTFYNRMDALCDGGVLAWRVGHVTCAQTLRKYADKYHPEVVEAVVEKAVVEVVEVEERELVCV